MREVSNILYLGSVTGFLRSSSILVDYIDPCDSRFESVKPGHRCSSFDFGARLIVVGRGLTVGFDKNHAHCTPALVDNLILF